MPPETESDRDPSTLITAKILTEALHNDVGPEAMLLAWEVKDFTKKGDNFISYVTGVEILYKIGDSMYNTSYVAKLNPLRPSGSVIDMLESTYLREILILTEITNGMNIELKKLNLPPLRIPKTLAYNAVKGGEIFIAEDLRNLDFKTVPKPRGLDINHALMVIEELGRFHASSVLFEETLPTKSILDKFPNVQPIWTDESTPTHELFRLLMSGQSTNACTLLKNSPQHERCLKWLEENYSNIGTLITRENKSKKPFDVLIHGDCWTNNILFKFNDEGLPIEVRLVDFQFTRKSSPGCEFNFFLYMSLQKETRKKYRQLLKVTYYISFLQVFLLAGKEPPFTFQEFEEELNNRMLSALLSGIIQMPAHMAEDEDSIFDFSQVTKPEKMDAYFERQVSKTSPLCEEVGPFKERFLSMIEEMIEANVFDKY